MTTTPATAYYLEVALTALKHADKPGVVRLNPHHVPCDLLVTLPNGVRIVRTLEVLNDNIHLQTSCGKCGNLTGHYKGKCIKCDPAYKATGYSAIASNDDFLVHLWRICVSDKGYSIRRADGSQRTNRYTTERGAILAAINEGLKLPQQPPRPLIPSDYPVGHVHNPVKLDIPAAAWEDTSDTSVGREKDGSRLGCTVQIGGVLFHAEAFEAKDNSGFQTLTNEDLSDTLDALFTIAGDSTDGFQTTEINGRNYIIVLTPFCR